MREIKDQTARYGDQRSISISGFASMIIPVYISEAAPLHLRGALVTCYQVEVVLSGERGKVQSDTVVAQSIIFSS